MHYEAPSMEVLSLNVRARLMQSSSGGYTGGGAYIHTEKDHFA